MTPTGSVDARDAASPSDADLLVVRRHERHECRLSAAAKVLHDSPIRVVLSRTAGDGTGVIPAIVVDCSAGGVGMETEYFLPRSAAIELTIQSPNGDALITVGGTIQRVTMTCRQPKYYIGVAFTGSSAPSVPTIDRLMTLCRENALGSPAASLGRSEEVERAQP